MKIICIGRNYINHAKELNNPVPAEPVIFTKPETAILKNNTPFFIPDFSKDVHHELELIVKISKEGKNIQQKFAHKYYDEIGLGIDFTARDIQTKLKERGLPWDLAKGFNGSAPVSEFFPKSQFSDVQNINFKLLVNNQQKQIGNTADMIFNIDFIISYISQYFLLKTGDIIFTGTPEGVAQVKSGDRLQAFLEDKKVMDFEVK